MKIKWEDVVNKLIVALLLALLGLVWQNHLQIMELSYEVRMVKESVLSVWESE